MNTARHGYSFLSRFLCLFLALYILNFSVDPRDADPDFIPEDLSFNDIESFSELVLEDIFDFTNAFEEHDERDGEDGTIDLTKEFCFENQHAVSICVPFNKIISKTYHIHDTKEIASLAVDVMSPPPKA